MVPKETKANTLLCLAIAEDFDESLAELLVKQRASVHRLRGVVKRADPPSFKTSASSWTTVDSTR